MNARERFLETLLFGAPDRIPLEPGRGRESTRERWHGEGLPEELDDARSITEYAYRQAGGRLELDETGPGFPVDERMMPRFEEKVLEKRERTQIVQDWKGNICEIGSEYTLEHLRSAIDFVTRRWIKCPVESWDDWEDMKKRYDPEEPARLPADKERLAEELKDRTWPVVLHFSGPFWQMREWLGFENLCMMFYDDPDLIRDMVSFWDAYVARLMERAFEYVVPDMVHISEDMAYKNFSMISPEMVKEYLSPLYAHWGEVLKKAGVPLYAVDSDGFVGELIPVWMEAGVNVCDPMEVAAGNDLNEFRKAFGKGMAYRGGVDKRAIAKGGAAIERELQRLEPVVRDGGYIPGCDHGVPADVSWPDFVRYVGLLARMTGWM